MKYKTCFLIVIFVSASFLGCKKSKALGCGCDSPVTGTYESVTGTLEYDSYSKQYSILAGGMDIDGSTNIICDTTIPGLQSFLDSARILGPTVTFSAQIKNYCLSDTVIYIGERRNINITQISY